MSSSGSGYTSSGGRFLRRCSTSVIPPVFITWMKKTALALGARRTGVPDSGAQEARVVRSHHQVGELAGVAADADRGLVRHPHQLAPSAQGLGVQLAQHATDGVRLHLELV